MISYLYKMISLKIIAGNLQAFFLPLYPESRKKQNASQPKRLHTRYARIVLFSPEALPVLTFENSPLILIIASRYNSKLNVTPLF